MRVSDRHTSELFLLTMEVDPDAYVQGLVKDIVQQIVKKPPAVPILRPVTENFVGGSRTYGVVIAGVDRNAWYFELSDFTKLRGKTTELAPGMSVNLPNLPDAVYYPADEAGVDEREEEEEEEDGQKETAAADKMLEAAADVWAPRPPKKRKPRKPKLPDITTTTVSQDDRAQVPPTPMTNPGNPFGEVVDPASAPSDLPAADPPPKRRYRKGAKAQQAASAAAVHPAHMEIDDSGSLTAAAAASSPSSPTNQD